MTKGKRRLLLGLSLLLFGCSSSTDRTFAFEPLEFEVNQELLDGEVVLAEADLSFGLPRHFIELPDSVMEAARDQLAGAREGDLPAFTPERAFIRPDVPGALILVSSVDTISGAATSLQYLKTYNSRFVQQYPESGVTSFTVNDIRAWQGVRLRGDQVLYRLLVERADTVQPVQIDLNVPRGQDEDYGKVLESLIGSMQRRGNNREQT